MEHLITITRIEYDSLHLKINDLSNQIFLLNELHAKKINELQQQILLLRNGKRSKTSNTSPSHDLGRKGFASLRTYSTKST